ncbi:MAG: hypothetical protein EBZ05_09575, partial [Verrucomicrobia bacterium]|nr:hypothetical protein [Verrucomicrobiota bacterium]
MRGDRLKSSSQKDEMRGWKRGVARIATLLFLGLSSCSSQPPPENRAETAKSEPTQEKAPTALTAEPAPDQGRMWKGKTL